MKSSKFPSGMLALVLGLALALSTQSFKADKSDEELYGFNQATQEWELVSDIPEGYTYECSEQPEEDCTAVFSVDPNENPEATPSELVKGRYEITPE